MAQGLQIWDNSGGLILNVTDNLTRVIGSTHTAKIGGSITNSLLLTGTPWCVVYNAVGLQCWNVTFSGSVMTWTIVPGIRADDSIITYGVY